jgi:hypothetical protein
VRCPAESTIHGHGISTLRTGVSTARDEQEVVYWAVSGHGALFNYTGHPAVVLPYKLDRDG